MKLFKNWFKMKKKPENPAGELHNDDIFWSSKLDELDVINNPDILFIWDATIISAFNYMFYYDPKKRKVYRTRSLSEYEYNPTTRKYEKKKKELKR